MEAVSGASYSSKAFLNAMEAALTTQVGTAAPRSSSTEQAKGEPDMERVVAGDIFPVFVQTIPLPADLPAPLERFYRTIYGERIPVITSVVMRGRTKIRRSGRPTFNARFRFTHIAVRSYRHNIVATFFGLPIMKINESYIDGHSRYETPVGLEEGKPKTVQAANLGMRAELSGVPAVLLTDLRVHWEAVDADMAILSKDSAQKMLWVTAALAWERLGEYATSTRGSTWWNGASRPWAIFSTEDIVLNADLSGYMSQRGE